MKLTDIASIEEWIELEIEINKRSGLNASVFDENGIRVTGFIKWANQLCPVIKAEQKGQTYICALAHQDITGKAKRTRKPVIEECDAGLIKLVVPIFIMDKFIGVVGGCGLLNSDNDIDTFLIHKTIGVDEMKIANLSKNIGSITDDKLQSLSAYITQQIRNHTIKSA